MNKKYYGIEVNHKSFPGWHSWHRLYESLEVAEEALKNIRRDNKRLADEGSQWRIFELIRNQ